MGAATDSENTTNSDNMESPVLTAEPPRQYHYRALSHKRAMRLISADITRHDGEICCQLFEVDADEPPPYHCLSYTWGNPFGAAAPKDSTSSPCPDADTHIWDQRNRIRVYRPGLADAGYLMITKNLHDFLEEFERCRPEDVEYLWVDAISINQGDLGERAVQVPMMKQVYSRCQAVVIWLGVHDADAVAAFTVIAKLAALSYEDFLVSARAANLGGTAGVNLPQLYAGLGIRPLPPDVLLSSAKFLQRSWLFRVWTLQESILPAAGRLWCGGLRGSPVGLGHLIILVNYAVKIHVHPVLSNMGHGTRGAVRPPPGIQESLERLRTSRERFVLKRPAAATYAGRDNVCSDPRDKIYGILGIIDGAQDYVVDYSKSVEDTYIEWALKRVGGGGPLENLEDPSTRLTQGLPSWVPDYRVPVSPRPWRTKAGWVYSAGRPQDSRPECLESDDPRILALPGVAEDVVAAVGASHDETIGGGDGLVQSLRLLLDQLDSSGLTGAGRDPVEQFWRTMIANLPGNGPRHPDADELGPSFRSLACYLIALQLSKDDGGETSNHQAESARFVVTKLREVTGSRHLPDWNEIAQLAAALREKAGDHGEQDGSSEAADGNALSGIMADLTDTMMPYLESLDSMFYRRRFFITAKGRLAAGPHVAMPSDRVFVLAGYPFPFVFRESESGSGRYRVLGEAYVDGIMFGEAIDGVEEFERVEIE